LKHLEKTMTNDYDKNNQINFYMNFLLINGI